jgi:hypothetical protein
VIDDCIDGKITIDYQCGHPFGFVNAIYMGELAHCKILGSNNSLISDQKKRLENFPLIYKKAAIENFSWECDFSRQCGMKALGKGDIIYAAGSLIRCAISLLQVLYAINEMYMLNEKGSLGRLLNQKDVYIPEDFANDIELIDNAREYSNGESAFRYFTEKIGENGLYLLDEPENSLSPKRQMELLSFLEESARFFGCQFIISTHSPFLLSMRGARIYNLDQNPVTTRRWTDLENVRTYFDFFKAHENEF